MNRSSARPRAAVIGGGISGLAAARKVAALGHDVTLFERADDLGGLGTTFDHGGCHLERFYHCILPNDDALIALIHEVGLGPELRWRETLMGFLYQGRSYPLNTPMDLLRFDPLGILARLRLGAMAVWARYRGEHPSMDEITAADWLRRMVGERAFEVVWKPLLSAKIGDSYDSIPALWLSSRLYREKNTAMERKGCLAGGYRSLIDALARDLRARGCAIRTGTPVRALTLGDGGMTITAGDAPAEHFDRVVSTLPTVALGELAGGLPVDRRLRELDLDYQGAICGVFLLDRPLSPYYWMPFVDCGATAQGVVEMSNLMPLERSDGLYVTYFVNYAHRSGELFALDDEALLARYQRDLDTLFPRVGARVVERYLFRAPFVEPIWTLGYRRRKPPATLIPGRLYMASTAQLYPRVNSWNSCCEVVEELHAEMAGDPTG